MRRKAKDQETESPRMTPRFGTPPVRHQAYRPRPGVYAILPSDAGLLLTFQEAPEPELQLPGGGIDPGESPLQALHREVREETGWKIADARRLGVYRRFAYMPEYDIWAEKICTIFVATPVLQLSEPTEPGHSVIWASAEQATELLASSGDAAFVARHIRDLR
ncbi:NUDIX hydrolase [Roseobacter sp. AzwK-3b]|nr:NUDIX hydrolase [Roseobacter sp. AzwK-3b]